MRQQHSLVSSAIIEDILMNSKLMGEQVHTEQIRKRLPIKLMADVMVIQSLVMDGAIRAGG